MNSYGSFIFALISLKMAYVATGVILTCPDGWSAWDTSCYRFYNNPKSTWDGAQAHCNRYSVSTAHSRHVAHLVNVDSSQEQNFILSWWKTMRTNYDNEYEVVWLGLNDKSKEGRFDGTDGCPPKFTFWDVNEPNNLRGEDCASIWNTHENHDNGAWNDSPCTDQYAFICEINF
ncbi:putative echinoidin isoform X2 [Apostichopus japonicus]|uniref:Putative echinoidin isoform X2 n=1 Tax=Stichopus japonicus TaxID=307972 RepID=A0A2G8JRW2_STIJA|nr:putative echinoidin isoform X2 [Apostichopus japonicus]